MAELGGFYHITCLALQKKCTRYSKINSYNPYYSTNVSNSYYKIHIEYQTMWCVGLHDIRHLISQYINEFILIFVIYRDNYIYE